MPIFAMLCRKKSPECRRIYPSKWDTDKREGALAKILVVDDQQGVRILLQMVFQEEGYKVRVAANGKEALNEVLCWHPHVVLMDLRTPLMDGLEALPRIKREAPETSVMVMSAYVEEDDVQELRRLGASDIICKPFDLDELKERVKALLPSWEKGKRAL